MAEKTAISWCDATLNFWIGCTKVSPACDHCYAEAWGKRFGVKWGPEEERRATKHTLRKVRALQRLAVAKRQAGGGAFFCFSNSLSDFFDKEVPLSLFAAAVEALRLAPDVTFLLLTKRPGIIVKRARAAAALSLGPYADDEGVRSWWPRNTALMCTVVNQPEADSELPKLLAAKAFLQPAFAGVSMEPLLGPVDDLLPFLLPIRREDGTVARPALDWVITGGESGPQARPSHPDWFRSVRDQCAAAGVPFHHKQHGEWKPVRWMTDGESDSLYHPAPKRDPEAIRRCKVENTVMNRDGSLHHPAAPETYHAHHGSMLMFKVGVKKAGRLIDGVLHDAMPELVR